MSSQHPASGIKSQTRTCLILALLLAAATLAVYGPVLRHGFVHIDDDIYVTENAHVRRGLTAATVRWAMTSAEGSNYWHPLTWLSHMLDVELYGLNPAGHHATSILLHAVNTGALFWVLSALCGLAGHGSCGAEGCRGSGGGGLMTGRGPRERGPYRAEGSAGGAEASMTPPRGGMWSCVLIAGLFGLHPLHVESVAWIAERKDVLSGLFWILAMGAYARYARLKLATRNVEESAPPDRVGRFPFHVATWYAATLACFVLALMSKPMAVTLPFVLLLLDWWPLGRMAAATSRFQSSVLLVAEKLPFFALAAVASYAAFRTQAGGGVVQTLAGLPLGARVANAVVSYGAYLVKTVWPVDLAVYYPHAGASLAGGAVAASAVVLLGITALALWQMRRRPYLLTGWFWYLGTLVPVIGLVQIGTFARADRYTYLPLIGVFWMVGGLVTGNWKLGTGGEGDQGSGVRVRGPGLRVTSYQLPATLVLLLTCALLTRHQLGYWRDDATLFGHTLTVTGGDAVSHDGLGLALLDAGRPAEAEAHFRESIRWLPDYARTHMRLGLALAAQGRPGEAAAAYREALRLMPDLAAARVNLGSLLLAQGQAQEAADAFEEALRQEPDLPEAHSNLAIAFHALQRMPEATQQMTEAVRLQPDNAVTRNNLGRLLFLQARYAEAALQFEEALRLSPGYAEAEQNLKAARAR